MNKRVFAGASALSLALPGLIASMALLPAANAIESDDGAGNLSSGDQLSSSATMEEQCKWVLTGAPSGVTLQNTAGAEYNGESLELSASIGEISIHSTGNQDTSPSYDTYTECAFFEAEFKPTATLSIGGTGFVASVGEAPDSGMDFDVSDSNPLAFTFTKDPATGTCDAWATAAESLNLTDTDAGTLLDLSISDVTSPVTSGGNNDKCELASGEIKVDIPAGKNPSDPGSDYTFTGPTLTTALSTATE